LFLDKYLTDYFTNPPDLVALRKEPHSRRDIMAALERPGCADALGNLIPAMDISEAMRRARKWNERLDSEEAERKSKEAEKRTARRMAARPASPK
jgi:hypothetical protein